MPKNVHVRLPYDERPAFTALHRRKQRWACLVCHRRAGKTVGVVNDIIIRGLLEKPPAGFATPNQYAYFAPYRSQAKSVAWEFFKHYTKPVRRKDPNEAELKIELVNGAVIKLFGADNADAARGEGFAGLVCDEYGDFRPSVWGNVLRPTLSDRKGWATFMGTPKGHNQFYDVYRTSKFNPEWFTLVLKASESGILDPQELVDARSQLSEDQYNQEYECSFDAAIMGAFYGREMARVDAENRICEVPHDPDFPVNTAWDLGHYDDTAIWWYQNIGDQVRILDYYSESGGTIEDYADGGHVPGSLTQQVIRRYEERGYRYESHWLPHDARAKTLGADGKSVVEKLARYLKLETLKIVPNLSLHDGIMAARTVLGRCWFDIRCGLNAEGEVSSLSGLEALRQYQREYNEDTHAFRVTPLHNWASHLADSFRYLAVAERRRIAPEKVIPREQRALMTIQKMIEAERRVTLDELWARRDEESEMRTRL